MKKFGFFQCSTIEYVENIDVAFLGCDVLFSREWVFSICTTIKVLFVHKSTNSDKVCVRNNI